MDIQLIRHNSKTHNLWKEPRTVSRNGHSAHRLTNCGEKVGQSAGMDIQLTRHNPKTHKLWREHKPVSRDGH
jgi:hypothetical protein